METSIYLGLEKDKNKHKTAWIWKTYYRSNTNETPQGGKETARCLHHPTTSLGLYKQKLSNCLWRQEEEEEKLFFFLL